MSWILATIVGLTVRRIAIMMRHVVQKMEIMAHVNSLFLTVNHARIMVIANRTIVNRLQEEVFLEAELLPAKKYASSRAYYRREKKTLAAEGTALSQVFFFCEEHKKCTCRMTSKS